MRQQTRLIDLRDELIVTAKNRRRYLFLPKFLAYYTLTNTQMIEGWLLIRFEKPKEQPGIE